MPRVTAPSAPPVRVLGIDPGTHVCGWGVVAAEAGRLRCEGYGVLRAPSTAPVERRLATIARGLREVIARHAPTEAAIEEAFYGRDVRAAVRIGEGRGAALVALADAGLPVRGYANNAVKHAVTGAGRAEKGRVHAMVKAILGLAEVVGPLDASDALAIAICHHHGRSLAAPRSRRSRLPPRIEAAVRAARATERVRRAEGAVR
jgi:crossover junction endodeoxyribonuclease RuvC